MSDKNSAAREQQRENVRHDAGLTQQQAQTQQRAQENVDAFRAYRGPQGATNPDGTPAPPPAHEETLGALAGAPKEVAEEYSRTGKTPRQFMDSQVEAAKRAAEAGDEAAMNRVGVDAQSRGGKAR